MFLKGYLISFLMMSRLIDFELILLYLFMFNVSGIIEVTIIEFFNYSRTDRVKRNQKIKKKKNKKIKEKIKIKNH